MNKKYTDFENARMKDQKDLKQYEERAEKDVKEIRTQYNQNKDKVKTYLLDNIMNINLVVPKVVIGNFEKDFN